MTVPTAPRVGRPVERRSRRTTITTAVVVFLLAAFFSITLVSQLVTFFYNPLKTETAYYYENVDSILFNGVYIRAESVFTSEEFAKYSDMGAIAYTNKCGSKLSINSVVAVVHSSVEDVYTMRKIGELNEQIEILSDAKRFAGVGTNNAVMGDNAQLEAFAGQLSDVHLQILRNVSNGDYELAAEYKNEYLSLQSKMTVSRGARFEVFEKRIGELKAEVSRLESQLSSSRGALKEFTLPKSGYFVSNADGYEETLQYKDALFITRERIEDVIAQPSLEVAGDVVGKIIDDYRWRMAALIETDKTRAISKGIMVELRIGAYPQPVSAQVIKADELGDGYTLFIFECELLVEEFVKKRVASSRLLLEDYSGIRLPRSAVTFNDDGESGVYIKDGSILYFRKINMLRSEEGFVIVENTDKRGYLRLFDEVVVRGRNLYDGKIIS